MITMSVSLANGTLMLDIQEGSVTAPVGRLTLRVVHSRDEETIRQTNWVMAWSTEELVRMLAESAEENRWKDVPIEQSNSWYSLFMLLCRQNHIRA